MSENACDCAMVASSPSQDNSKILNREPSANLDIIDSIDILGDL
jgi:ABC-type enterochelin transport system ATPase subunit